MRRLLLTLLLAPLLSPVAAPAQSPLSGLSLSAVTGVRVPFTTGPIGVYDTEGRLLTAPRQERGGTPILGLEGRARITGPLALVVGGTYSRSGDINFMLPDTAYRHLPALTVIRNGSTLFGRAGLGLRFEGAREPGATRAAPSTDLVLAGGVLHEMGTTQPALSAGFTGSLPVTRFADFVVGLDDYLVFWDTAALSAPLGDRLQVAYPQDPIRVRLLYDTSNILLIRLGFALHP
jgi:hypothetical protein